MAELFQIEIAILDLIPVMNFLLCTILYNSRYQVKVMQCKSVSIKEQLLPCHGLMAVLFAIKKNNSSQYMDF